MTPSPGLAFRIGNVPVRILPSFFVAALVLNLGSTSASALVSWMAVVLGSVLVHEFGHAGAVLACGLEPSIQLHGMGGTTTWKNTRTLPVAARIGIDVAGPAAGFLVAAAVRFGLGPQWFAGATASFVYRSILWVNFGWGIFNLLPIMPLDGGAVLLHLLNAATHGRGERPARIVSIAVAGLAGLAALWVRWTWPAILAASFVATNWRGLSDANAAPPPCPDSPTRS